jgi:hypothetical protein
MKSTLPVLFLAALFIGSINLLVQVIFLLLNAQIVVGGPKRIPSDLLFSGGAEGI